MGIFELLSVLMENETLPANNCFIEALAVKVQS